MSKAAKIYRVICIVLLGFCMVFYWPMKTLYFNITLDLKFYQALGLFFAVLATIYFNCFDGPESGAGRFFGSILVLSYSTGIFYLIFYGIDWVFEHSNILHSITMP